MRYLQRKATKLGFELTLSTRDGVIRPRDTTAYAGHKWYQLDGARLETFKHALGEIAEAIDRQTPA